MLPKRFALTRNAEEKLKREKLRAGISPNILARELFFKSIEKNKKIEMPEKIDLGTMLLDKAVWLGDCQTVIEHWLNNSYPKKTAEEHAYLWALHVDSEL